MGRNAMGAALAIVFLSLCLTVSESNAETKSTKSDAKKSVDANDKSTGENASKNETAKDDSGEVQDMGTLPPRETNPDLVKAEETSISNTVLQTSFWFQPQAGKSFAEFGLLGTSIKYNEYSVGTSTQVALMQVSRMPFYLKYGYGLSDNHTVGAWLDYGTDSITTTPTGGSDSTAKNSGIGDIRLYYNGSHNSVEYGLQYGCELSINTGNQIQGIAATGSTSAQDGNRSSGGPSVQPYIGIHFPLATNSLGAKFSYLLNFNKTTSQAGSTGTTGSVSGGNSSSLTAYYEFNHERGAVDAYVQLVVVADSTTTYGSSSSAAGGNDVVSIGGKGNYNISPSMSLLYDLSFNSQTNYNVSTSLRQLYANYLSWGVAGRFVF